MRRLFTPPCMATMVMCGGPEEKDKKGVPRKVIDFGLVSVERKTLPLAAKSGSAILNAARIYDSQSMTHNL